MGGNTAEVQECSGGALRVESTRLHLPDQDLGAGNVLELSSFSRSAAASFGERITRLLGSHQYVSFCFNEDGRSLHLSRLSDGSGVGAHVVEAKVLPSGARYSSIEARVFVQNDQDPDAVATSPAEDLALANALAAAEHLLAERAGQPLLVNVSPQGYHENEPRRERLGLRDTGGQDKYINDLSFGAAETGIRVLNVNRAGPNHPINHDVRAGMHYSHTGVDLLFIQDGRPEVFVAKEEMYPEIDLSRDRLTELPRGDAVFHPLGRALAAHLLNEPQVMASNKVTLIGHYVDGITTALHTRSELEDAGIDRLLLKVVGIPHSTGPAKERGLIAAKQPVPDDLRLPVRREFEGLAFRAVDILVSTSHTMSDSFRDDYGRKPNASLIPGVNAMLFRPRSDTRPKDHPSYEPVWQELSALSGAPVAELQRATLVMEVSRTAASKGKDIVVSAFARALHRNPDMFLIINAADPDLPNISAEERHVGLRVRSLIDQNGIRDRVALRSEWPNHQVATLSKLADIFISGATSEPWGMSVTQAGAAGMAVISSDAVPAATEVLWESDDPLTVQAGDFAIGAGAGFYQSGDPEGAARLIAHFAENPALRKQLGARAHKLTEPYHWNRLITDFLEHQCGMTFEEGKVDPDCVVPQSRHRVGEK